MKSFRNTEKMINLSKDSFQFAYEQGVMGVPSISKKSREIYLTRTKENIVDFVRCGYLGLDSHPKVVQGAHKALDDYSSTHWSCARTRLNYALLMEFEEYASYLFNARIISFSTVTLANMGILPLIASGAFTDDVKPTIVFDRKCHSSLAYHKPVLSQETEVITIDHNDLDALEAICKRKNIVAYIADGVYSMGGEAPIDELKVLQEKYGLFLYIDDAHGISIVGKNGEGYARSKMYNSLGDRTAIAASLGKGFGASGGMLMLGSKKHEELIRCYAQPYAFSAAPNVAAVGAAMASAKIHATGEINKLQEQLQFNLKLFDKHIQTQQASGLLPIRMITIGDDKVAIQAANQLMKLGFYTSAVFFPTVARGQAALRISISADHRPKDILSLCDLFNKKKYILTSSIAA